MHFCSLVACFLFALFMVLLLHFLSHISFVSWLALGYMGTHCLIFFYCFSYDCWIMRANLADRDSPFRVFICVADLLLAAIFHSFSLLSPLSRRRLHWRSIHVYRRFCVSLARNTWSAHMISLFIYLFIWCSFNDVQKFILNSFLFRSLPFSSSISLSLLAFFSLFVVAFPTIRWHRRDEEEKKRINEQANTMRSETNTVCALCSRIGGKLWMKLICIGYIGLFFAAWLLWSCGCTQHFSALQRFLFDCFLFWSSSCLHDAHLRTQFFFICVPIFSSRFDIFIWLYSHCRCRHHHCRPLCSLWPLLLRKNNSILVWKSICTKYKITKQQDIHFGCTHEQFATNQILIRSFIIFLRNTLS